MFSSCIEDESEYLYQWGPSPTSSTTASSEVVLYLVKLNVWEIFQPWPLLTEWITCTNGAWLSRIPHNSTKQENGYALLYCYESDN